MARNGKERDLSRLFSGLALLLFLTPACGLLEEDADQKESGNLGQTTGWASQVVSVAYGRDAGFGQGLMPDVVLGPPNGAGTMSGSLDVLSLGVGGEIVLSFGQDACVVDGEGEDLVVCENVFFVGGDGTNRFIETGRVSVSKDGQSFMEFPTRVDDRLPIGHPDRYEGFAGVEPCLPGREPDTVGGDRFDLAELGLKWAR